MADASVPGSTKPRPRILSFAIGVVGGVLGLLPWLMGAWMRRDDASFAVLPISRDHATLLVSLVLLGGVFAGLAVHFLGRRRRTTGWPAALGVALVHLIAVGLRFSALADELRIGDGGDEKAMLYFAGMLAGTIAAVLAAQVGFHMASSPSAGVVSVGVALAAVPFATWVGRCFVAFAGEGSPPAFLPTLLHWLPAVIVGVALVWCGVRPVWRRIVAWVISLLSLWLALTLFMVIEYAFEMRELPAGATAREPARVLAMVLEETWFPVVVAFAIGIVGTAVRMLIEWGVSRGRVAAE